MVDVTEKLETIKTVIDNHAIDVWKIATNKQRDTQVFLNDIRLNGGDFPKIHIQVDGEDIQKLNWGGGKNFHRERRVVSANLFFFNKSRQKYISGSTTYEDGGANTSRSLNFFMRNHIRETLIEQAGSLLGINNLKFGSLSETTLTAGEVHGGFVPLTFEYMVDVGGN